MMNKVGFVVDGSDHFIRPIEREFCKRFQVSRFTPRFVHLPLIGQRVNEWLLDKQLERFLGQNDAVFFEWAASLLIRATRLPRRGKIITRLHSVELATAAEQIDWSRVDTLIVLNNFILAQLSKMVGRPLPPVEIVANGVDLSHYKPLIPNTFNYRLGMVCNIHPIKRIYEIILALYQLRKEGYPYTLQIAGRQLENERQYAWALEGLVRKLSLSETVHFHGYVNDIASWLQQIDVFISNSYWEGQQVALMEAMASGCHCLAHHWGGVEEMLPSDHIYFTDSDLREKLKTYAGETVETKRDITERLRSIAEERFNEQRMVLQIFQVVEAIISG